MTPNFYAMPASQYHADPAPRPSLSSSIARILLRESPRKAWFSHPKLNPAYRPEHDDKFDIGTAAHALLLENDTSGVVIVEANDWRTKAAQEAREIARAAGKTPLLKRHFEATEAMVGAAREFIARSEIAEYWAQAESEVTGIWEERGVWLRCRFDRLSLNRRCVMDYKSTSDVSPDGFSRQLVRMGYYLQDAFYRRAIRALHGKDPAFVFVAQSVEPPYECTLHGCDPALREIADAEIERAIGIWRSCLDNNKWPSYDGRIHWTVPTTWQMNAHEERLLEAA